MQTQTGFLRHFHACNAHDLTRSTPFLIDGTKLGWVEKQLATQLTQKFSFFSLDEQGFSFILTCDDFIKRSEALQQATEWIAAQRGDAMRNEMYPIIANWGDQPLAQIDRAGVPWFGVRGFGVHVNGFVRKADGLYLWVGERAQNRPIDPGKLDNLIGGGQPIGLTPLQNVVKEAQEEAGIEANLAKTAHEVGSLRYLLERPEGLRSDTLFLFDLELPEDFIPRNTDGEVAAFHLWPLSEVATIVQDTNRFKFNCNLVIIDFMIRHGFLTPTHPEYEALISFVK